MENKETEDDKGLSSYGKTHLQWICETLVKRVNKDCRTICQPLLTIGKWFHELLPKETECVNQCSRKVSNPVHLNCNQETSNTDISEGVHCIGI